MEQVSERETGAEDQYKMGHEALFCICRNSRKVIITNFLFNQQLSQKKINICNTPFTI